LLRAGVRAVGPKLFRASRRPDDLARQTGARRMTGAKIWLCALSHLSAEHFRDHFAI
jgi:hypothetical protein